MYVYEQNLLGSLNFNSICYIIRVDKKCPTLSKQLLPNAIAWLSTAMRSSLYSLLSWEGCIRWDVLHQHATSKWFPDLELMSKISPFIAPWASQPSQVSKKGQEIVLFRLHCVQSFRLVVYMAAISYNVRALPLHKRTNTRNQHTKFTTSCSTPESISPASGAKYLGVHQLWVLL